MGEGGKGYLEMIISVTFERATCLLKKWDQFEAGFTKFWEFHDI